MQPFSLAGRKLQVSHLQGGGVVFLRCPTWPLVAFPGGTKASSGQRGRGRGRTGVQSPGQRLASPSLQSSPTPKVWPGLVRWPSSWRLSSPPHFPLLILARMHRSSWLSVLPRWVIWERQAEASPGLSSEWRRRWVVPDRGHIVVAGDVAVFGGIVVVGGHGWSRLQDAFRCG